MKVKAAPATPEKIEAAAEQMVASLVEAFAQQRPTFGLVGFLLKRPSADQVAYPVILTGLSSLWDPKARAMGRERRGDQSAH